MRAKPLSLFSLPIACVVGLFVAGCGGGGGGSAQPTISITTDWTTSSAPGQIDGVSERITFHPLATPTSVSNTINLSSTGTFQLTNVPTSSGSYLLHVDLYSGPSQSGSITGSLDTVVSTSTNNSVKISVGQAFTSLVLNANATSLGAGGTGYVYVAPTTAAGNLTFAAPSDLTFASTNHAYLTVSADTADTAAGDLTGVAIGTASITASSTSRSITSAPLSITVNATKAWTIMVFMNAANSLLPEALPNYLQMQKAALQGTNAQVIVAWKEAKGYGYTNNFGTYDWSFNGTDDTRYYLVQGSSSNSIVGNPIVDLGAGVDMGSTAAAANFVSYCKAHYPAQHYLFDLWDHGSGWQDNLHKPSPLFRGVSFDEVSGNDIHSWQMDQCFTNGNNVDVLVYDACEMQMIECGYQVASYVNYIVASEDDQPGAGYDYSVVFAPFYSSSSTSTPTLCNTFVDQMINESNTAYSGYPLCQSVIDASKLATVASDLDALGAALSLNKASVTNIVQSTRSTVKYYNQSNDPVEFYYDGIGVANSIAGGANVPSGVVGSATALSNAIKASVLYNRYDLNNQDAGSNGLALDFSTATAFNELYSGETAAAQYQQLKIYHDYPRWYNWLEIAP